MAWQPYPLYPVFDIYFRYLEVKYAKPHAAFLLLVCTAILCGPTWIAVGDMEGRHASSTVSWRDWQQGSQVQTVGMTSLKSHDFCQQKDGFQVSHNFICVTLNEQKIDMAFQFQILFLQNLSEQKLPYGRNCCQNKALLLIRLFFRPHWAALSCSLCCSCVVCSYGLWCCGTGHPKRWQKWGEWMVSCQRNQGVNFWKSSGPIVTYDHLSR